MDDENGKMRGKSLWSAEGRHTALYILVNIPFSNCFRARAEGFIKEDSRGIGGVILHLHLKRSDVLIHVDMGYGFSCFTVSNVSTHIFKNGKGSYHHVTGYNNTSFVGTGMADGPLSVTTSSWGSYHQKSLSVITWSMLM